jgi:mono/diheme cytochrome c family protein
MQSHIKSGLAIALSAVILCGAGYSNALAQKKKPAPKKAPAASGKVTPAMIEAGKKVYTANGCAACHMIAGVGGKTSSDLSKIGSNKDWPADKLAAVVRDPKKFNKESTMPAYGKDKISDKDLKNLVGYMQSLK